ncbi:related to HLJ1 protein [Cephalotrichum gorgonifer]|uniref:Related to HLJ1 protein n=1 Tax=Cephalotrichum gorgonifer TaxID=2041049 RepID=A0AAE8MYZ5_9PEZI|nr:related to HLJ1 protein [Cephalotrichum gorgonifer]
MSSAKASGSDAKGGSAQNRKANNDAPERRYTVEQKAEVLRIRRCEPTAFYDILSLESVRKTATDADIKKAYRKLSLATHPDKNGHEFADEAFKMVSRAFGVLGDKEKREKYDRFGGDPDSRFGGQQQQQQQNPFSGFARRHPADGMGGAGWQQEMTPEEMFQRFFGGGGFGGGFGGGPFGAFDTGPQFVFNMGGGPGIRVHQFGGARPQRRPRAANEPEQSGSALQTILGLLPIILFFIIPVLTSLFSGSGTDQPAGPRMVYDQPMPPYTEHRQTPSYKVDYFVNPDDIASFSESKLTQLDKTAESNLVRLLRRECESEERTKQRLIDDAYGWIFPDQKKMERANQYEMPACQRIHNMGLRR